MYHKAPWSLGATWSRYPAPNKDQIRLDFLAGGLWQGVVLGFVIDELWPLVIQLVVMYHPVPLGQVQSRFHGLLPRAGEHCKRLNFRFR